MKNSGFCIPIHRTHFNYGVDLIKSYNKHYNDKDIFLVFSNQDDAVLFYNNNPNLVYQTIVWNGEDELGRGMHYDGIINRKKFYGLTEIYKNTDLKYIGVIDAESLFVKHLDYSFLFEKFYKEHTFCVHPCSQTLVANIHQACLSFFTNSEQQELNNIILTVDNKVNYFWFNNIPVYERDNYNKFSEIVCNYKNPNINHYTFDYICYGYWLLLTKQFKLKHIDSDALWSMGESSRDVNHFSIIKPMWIRNSLDTTEGVSLPKEVLENVFLKFHLNR